MRSKRIDIPASIESSFKRSSIRLFRFSFPCLFGILSLIASHYPLATVVHAADPGIEFGTEDDLTVLGVQGSAPDPDVEVKGFTVFGSTQVSYAGAAAGPGNVVVNGVLSVSSGAYFAAESTFTAISVGSITTSAAGVTFSTNVFVTSGNVGIGTTAPAVLLTLNHATSPYMQFNIANGVKAYFGGIGSASALVAGSAVGDIGVRTEGGNMLFSTDVGVSAQMYLKNNGNVGIGTVSPGYDSAGWGASSRYLTVLGPGSAGNVALLQVGRATAADDEYVGVLDFINTGNTGAAGAGRYGIAQIRALNDDASGSGGDSGGHMAFVTKADAGAAAERMRITSAGDVGIGTAAPQEKLNVNGAILFGDTASTCDAAHRGAMKFVAGTSDSIYACMSSGGSYAWEVVVKSFKRRYVRLTLTNGTSGNVTIQVAELNLFDSKTNQWIVNNMTSSSAPAPKSVSYTATSYSSSAGWKIFDGQGPTGDYNAGYMTSAANSYVLIDFGAGNGISLTKYRLWTSSYSDGGGTYRPSAWTLETSVDGSAWDTVDTRSGVSPASGSYVEFEALIP